MIDQKAFYNCLRQEGVEFFTGVPDTLLNDFCLYVQEHCPGDHHVIAANEGNSIALASGYYLATGATPLVYMQNSGMGNALNPLISLAGKDLYGIPMILLIGWRGDPAVGDHPQHRKQGELTPVLLDDLGVPYKVLVGETDADLESTRWAARTAQETNAPVGLISKKGALDSGEKEDLSLAASDFELSREEAMKCVIALLPEDTIYVATTGRASRELYDIRRHGVAPGLDFLNVGAMGHACSIATGVALAKPNRLVVCLDGDAATIMHMGALTTSGKAKASNLLHVVMNNGVHESVGGQPTAGFDVNLTGIAANSGYKTLGAPVFTRAELEKSIHTLRESGGPAFLDVHIRKGMRQGLAKLVFDPQKLKAEFMKAVN